MCQNVKMSKDVNLSKRCQMSNSETCGLWKRFTKKNGHNEVHRYWCQFWRQISRSSKLPKNYFLWTFWGFLVTIICDVKIDINIYEPHYVDLFLLVNLLHSPTVWLFDIFFTIWHLFDILTSYWHFDIFWDILTSFDIVAHHLNQLTCHS